MEGKAIDWYPSCLPPPSLLWLDNTFQKFWPTPLGAASLLPLGAAKAGSLHLKYPLGERNGQTISIICLAAPLRRCELPLSAKCWTNPEGPLYQSLFWCLPVPPVLPLVVGIWCRRCFVVGGGWAGKAAGDLFIGRGRGGGIPLITGVGRSRGRRLRSADLSHALKVHKRENF
jgi:hypothetical protein